MTEAVTNRPDDALVIVDELLRLARPDSPDFVRLNLMKGQFLLLKDDVVAAIAPLEATLQVVEKPEFNHFLPPFERLDLHRMIAGAYATRANSAPTDEARKPLLQTAEKHQMIYVQNAPRVNDADLSLLAYTVMGQIDPDNPAPDLVAKAEDVLNKGLRVKVQPNWEFVGNLTVLARAQASAAVEKEPAKQNEYWKKAAQYLEFTLAYRDSQPLESRTESQAIAERETLNTLVTTYQILGDNLTNGNTSDGEDMTEGRNYFIRAIAVYKRGQARGFLDTERDHLGLASIYYRMEQVSLAAETLEKALRAGKVNPTVADNWSYLANYYLDLHQQQKAIDTLKEAATRFPNHGKFDFQVAQAYQELNDIPQALEAAKRAASKGVQDRTGTIWLTVAYFAYDLERYQEAFEAVTKAEEFPDTRDNPSRVGMRTAILEQLYDGAHRAAVRDGRKGDLWMQAARYATLLNENEDALEAVTKALELDDTKDNAEAKALKARLEPLIKKE